MVCWSCRKEIQSAAQFCPHCEAKAIGEPTAAEMEAVQGVLSSMNPDLIAQLLEKSVTGEEFVNQIMVGDCPKCGISSTSDCESDPEIEDPCVARCFECPQLWCPDCGELSTSAHSTDHDCPTWEDVYLDSEGWEDAE